MASIGDDLAGIALISLDTNLRLQSALTARLVFTQRKLDQTVEDLQRDRSTLN